MSERIPKPHGALGRVCVCVCVCVCMGACVYAHVTRECEYKSMSVRREKVADLKRLTHKSNKVIFQEKHFFLPKKDTVAHKSTRDRMTQNICSEKNSLM